MRLDSSRQCWLGGSRGFGAAFVLIAWLVLGGDGNAIGDEVDYLQQVKPLLRERCFACHGALKQEGGLRLDTVELALKGGDSGPVIAVEAVGESELLRRIAATELAERMPPEHEGEPLTTEQIALVQRWIESGANGSPDELPEADPSKHWAFQPITRPAVPQLDSSWIRNPIDAFLAQQHQKQGLDAQPEAADSVLLRRLYFDLLGLPPNEDDIAAFASIPSPLRLEQTAERLLDDPRYGERWARHWMDIWRYSDWWGLGDQLRNSQKHIWHWRDWIVESLNEDVPYDEMVRLMLAADELHPNDLSKLRATGYLARNYFLFNRPQWMEETVEHVSKGFLGLTMNCAKCHDHKFDPLEQNDFYRMRAFFEPYHVRLDMLPGEPDLAVDGIPRAYDRQLDVPTYRYIRGDEKNADVSKAIAPAVPKILALDELRIEPVALPSEAWQPERRPWVAETLLAAARKRVEAVERDVQKSQEKLTAARRLVEQPAASGGDGEKRDVGGAPSDTDLVERFETLDEERWKSFGGEWVHESGRLEQRRDGAARSAQRLLSKVPQDFDATLRFKTLGGSQWRSVGLAFDVSQEDPTQTPAATDSEQNIYVSAVAGGSKVQASFQRGGLWQFPGGEAVRPMPIELDREYKLRVQVRGTLVNASLDDQPLIAWETPLERRVGAMEIMTFDALAVFYEVTIRKLDPAVELRIPSGSNRALSPAAAVANALSEFKVAETALAHAQAEYRSIELRAVAQIAESQEASEALRESRHAAISAERLAQVAKLRNDVAIAEQTLLRAASDQREAAEKGVKSAGEMLEKAILASNAQIVPADQFTRLVGALWTPTRFLNSGQDDPAVDFPSTSSGRRTALANWITDRRNPLTARVAANHLWTRHMGQPLVPTMFDFGRKGIPPTHPELLDWLASELIDSGWSMKHLHRLIVNSAAYRMSSSTAHADANVSKDPENHYLWRRVPIRIESQVVRDSLLALAGTLDPTVGGPSVPMAMQAASTRRSLYFFHSNNDRSLFLTTFDEALVKDCYRREQSIVPQQALALSNSQLVLESAEQIANRLTTDTGGDAGFIRRAFHIVVGIEASKAEIEASEQALEAWRKLPDGNQARARANFIWTLINHNDFITLR